MYRMRSRVLKTGILDIKTIATEVKKLQLKVSTIGSRKL
jgi:hypothetical protein